MNVDIIAVAGLLLLVGLFFLLRREERKKPEKYRQITAMQAVGLTIMGAVAVVLLFLLAKDVLSNIWDRFLTPI